MEWKRWKEDKTSEGLQLGDQGNGPGKPDRTQTKAEAIGEGRKKKPKQKTGAREVPGRRARKAGMIPRSLV